MRTLTPGVVTQLSEEIRTALAAHGWTPRSAALVSPLGARKGRRGAYRVEIDAGRVVKARQFEDAETARRGFELRAGLEAAFAPALARYDSVILEEWIEGVPVAADDWDRWVEPAGALLGRLHVRPLPPEAPATTPTRGWIADVAADLETLGTARVLTSAEVARLRAAIAACDPGAARTTLAHLDFCADNMVIDGQDRLRVIDNELLAIRPPGLDLARTFHLWPMPAAAWARFRRGYLSVVAADPGGATFWQLVATLRGVRIFLTRSPARRDATLALLRRLLAEVPADPPR
jgi:Ser/Thr protein kinase RdoA (MazF antagonist)